MTSPTEIETKWQGAYQTGLRQRQVGQIVGTYSGRYTELTRDGGRGFASAFLHRRKADPTARPYPLPGTLTFFGTVFMAL